MMRRLFAVLALGALPCFPLAACEAAKTEIKTESLPSVSVPAYGDKNAACREWSDGCAVCTRAADGPQCSTPGIACQPAEIACQRNAD
jgi:hypothetical protein